MGIRESSLVIWSYVCWRCHGSVFLWQLYSDVRDRMVGPRKPDEKDTLEICRLNVNWKWPKNDGNDKPGKFLSFE